jgi:hypothetical protein
LKRRHVEIEDIAVQDKLDLARWNLRTEQLEQGSDLGIWKEVVMAIAHPQIVAIDCLPKMEIG